MLRNINIEGYRGFDRLAIEGLKRVNLFVGRNNSGKSSVLEAAQIIASEGAIGGILSSLKRRGEIIPGNQAEGRTDEIDLPHLFHGHKIKLGSAFKLEGFNDRPVSITCEISTTSSNEARFPLLPGLDENEEDSAVGLNIIVDGAIKTRLPLSAFGTLPVDWTRRRPGNGTGLLGGDTVSNRPVRVVPAEGLAPQSMSLLWDGVALTPEEPKLIEALQIIEPGIERIAFLARETARPSAGIVVKLKDSDTRVPLGSLGDGVKRLLFLSLSAIHAACGYLIIDELDTGLHYSVIDGMWRMLITTAQRLDIQIFATTHSQDCVTALGRLHEDYPELAREVAVHRLEKGLAHSVCYEPGEISTAALQEIEIR